MICTPMGIGPATGTATTGSPMNEIGWVKMPMFGRTGNSTPSSTNVFCPISGAEQGVAGAIMASTVSNSRTIASWNQRRNFCAWMTMPAGTMVPAIRRSRTSGSKSAGRSRRRPRCRAAPSAVVIR